MPDSFNSKILLSVSKWLLYAALFCVVLVMPATFFPFIGIKYYFFRTVVQLSLALLVVYWGFYDKQNKIWERLKKVSKRPLFIAVSIFVLVGLLASIFAFDPFSAFWSNFERGEGSFQLVHYYIFFVLASLLFENSKDWKNAFIASLIAAGLMILYGVFAQLGWNSSFISPYRGTIPDNAWDKLTFARFQGSLGNPSYVAPYLMFSIFYVLYLWFQKKITSKSLLSGSLTFIGVTLISVYLLVSSISRLSGGEGLPLLWSLPGIAVLIGAAAYVFKKKQFLAAFIGLIVWIFGFFLILSQTRGAVLGIAISIFVLLVYLAIFSTGQAKKWLIGLLAAAIIGGGFLIAFRNNPTVQSLPGGRVLELFDKGLSTDSAQTRFWTWGSAWRGFQERPVLGWGQENFSIVFDRHFDPRHYVPGKNSETWFDRAHSVFFDYLAETGILGLLSYIAMFVVFYWEVVKNWNKKFELYDEHQQSAEKHHSHIILRGLMIVLPIAYLIQALALFDVLPIYINLFLFLAFSSYIFSNRHESHI